MVCLKLVSHSNGSVSLMTCDERGATRWFVMAFNRDGTFFRHRGVGDDTGFRLDENGRIIERGSRGI